MLAEIGNGMADLLATHFNSGLVAAKLGGGERPVCGNPGTGALWRDLGFVAQRYVVKVLWYSRITSFFCYCCCCCCSFSSRTRGVELGSAFWLLLDYNSCVLRFWMLSCILTVVHQKGFARET